MVALPAWTIRVEGAGIQSHTFALQEKDGCFLGAHTKLAGFDKMVRLSTPELAQQYIDAVTNVMKKRHGEFVSSQLRYSAVRGGAKILTMPLYWPGCGSKISHPTMRQS